MGQWKTFKGRLVPPPTRTILLFSSSSLLTYSSLNFSHMMNEPTSFNDSQRLVAAYCHGFYFAQMKQAIDDCHSCCEAAQTTQDFLPGPSTLPIYLGPSDAFFGPGPLGLLDVCDPGTNLDLGLGCFETCVAFAAALPPSNTNTTTELAISNYADSIDLSVDSNISDPTTTMPLSESDAQPSAQPVELGNSEVALADPTTHRQEWDMDLDILMEAAVADAEEERNAFISQYTPLHLGQSMEPSQVIAEDRTSNDRERSYVCPIASESGPASSQLPEIHWELLQHSSCINSEVQYSRDSVMDGNDLVEQTDMHSEQGCNDEQATIVNDAPDPGFRNESATTVNVFDTPTIQLQHLDEPELTGPNNVALESTIVQPETTETSESALDDVEHDTASLKPAVSSRDRVASPIRDTSQQIIEPAAANNSNACHEAPLPNWQGKCESSDNELPSISDLLLQIRKPKPGRAKHFKAGSCARNPIDLTSCTRNPRVGKKKAPGPRKPPKRAKAS